MQRRKLKPTNAVEEGRKTEKGKREGIGGTCTRSCSRKRKCQALHKNKTSLQLSQVGKAGCCKQPSACWISLQLQRGERLFPGGDTEGGPRLMLAVLLLQQLKASSMLEMQSKCKTTANYVESEWRSEGEAGEEASAVGCEGSAAVHDKRTSRGKGSAA